LLSKRISPRRPVNCEDGNLADLFNAQLGGLLFY
jgi:hypothetical protein